MPVGEYPPQGTCPYFRPLSTQSATSSEKEGVSGREISLGLENQAPCQDATAVDWARWCRRVLCCSRPVKVSGDAHEQDFLSSVRAVLSRSGMSEADRARVQIEAIEAEIFNEAKRLIELLRSLHNDPTLKEYLDKQLIELGLNGVEQFEACGSLASPNAGSQGNALSWWDVGAGLQSTAGQMIYSCTKVGAITVGASVAGFLASYIMGGMAAQGAHLLGGGLALGEAFSTITQLRQTVGQEAFKNRVNASKRMLGSLVKTHAELIEQEKRRAPLSDIANVISQENQKHIAQLTTQRALIQAELIKRGTEDPTLASWLGSESLGKKILRAISQAKAAFASFFSPVVNGLSRLGGLFTGLPDVIRRAYARRQADKQEQAFLADYHSQLEVLAKPPTQNVRTCLIDRQDILLATKRARRYGPARNRTVESVERQAYVGENLAHLIRTSAIPVFIDVQVNAHGAIPASLTLARALSWYLEIEAHQAGTSDDGGLITVDDPGGKLYAFLTSVPVAYSGTMAAVNDARAPLGVLNIDDHGAGFPRGASCMQFEQDLDGNGQLRLRLRFVEDPVAHVYVPLENAGAIWKELSLSTGDTSTDVQQPGEVDFSETSNVALQRRQEQLGSQIEMKKRLEERNEGFAGQVQNWSQLPFMRPHLPRT